MLYNLFNGDSREILKTLEENSVDSIVTDPPYHLTSIVKRFGKTSKTDDTQTSERIRNSADGYARFAKGFMGKLWDGGDIAFDVEFWELCYRVLKPGGYLLAFGASRNYHRMACAIEDCGFEVRDSLMWIYGTGMPKSHDISKFIDKKLGVEPNVVGKYDKTFRNPKTEGISDGWDRPSHGSIGNITEPTSEEAKHWKGWGTALKPAFEPIVMCRKPLSENSIAENILKHGVGGINIDESRISYSDDNPPIPQIANDKRDIKSKKTMFDGNSLHKSNTQATIGGSLDGRWPSNVLLDGSNEVDECFDLYSKNSSRFFYSAKTSTKEKNEGLEDDENIHPTIKPKKLMSYLVNMVTPKDGTVLDPFMGSGSTGCAALENGFKFIGIEREKTYFDIAQKRIDFSKKECTMKLDL